MTGGNGKRGSAMKKVITALAIAAAVVIGALVWWFLVGLAGVLSGGTGT